MIKIRGRARTDSTHVVAAIRQLNRIECVGETLRHALNDLATVAPGWLKTQVNPDWERTIRETLRAIPLTQRQE